MTKKETTKISHKAARAAVDDKCVYEDTEFGRRPISNVPKALSVLFWLVGAPVVFIYHKLRGKRSLSRGASK